MLGILRKIQYKVDPKIVQKGYDRGSSRDTNPKMADLFLTMA